MSKRQESFDEFAAWWFAALVIGVPLYLLFF